MADVAISGLTALGAAPATNDLLVTVDVDDTTQAPTGTTKKMTVANLFTSPHMTGAVVDSGGLTVTTGGFVVAAGGLTAFGTSATAIIANWDGPGGGLEGIIAVQRASVNRYFIGVNASDNGAILNAAGSAANLSWTDAGAFTIRSTLAVASDLAVNTNKFTVAASTGNTVVAGTLGVTSDFAIATNKFTVAAATGNTVVAGTLGVTGAITGGGSITTGPPIGGTTAQWKVGIQHFATVTLLTSQYIELDVNGTLYKLATVS